MQQQPNSRSAHPRSRPSVSNASPAVAGILSAFIPGLGQAAAGQPRRGAVIAIPVLTGFAALILIGLFDRSVIFGALNDKFLLTLLILDLLVLLYRLWATLDAYLIARGDTAGRRRTTVAGRSAASAGLAFVLIASVGIQGVLAWVIQDARNQAACIQDPRCNTDTSPTMSIPSDDPGADGALDTPTPGVTSSGPAPTLASFDPSLLPTPDVPVAGDWAKDGQFNVLLIGADFGPKRSGLRPDTMIVVHIDLATRRAAMIGIGRNNICVPLPASVAMNYATPNNGCPAYTWSGYKNNPASAELNWLAMEAWNNPRNWPMLPQGSDMGWYRGAMATEMALSALTGLTIDGYVTINLEGLSKLIDDLGGIDINVPTTVYDKPCGPRGTWMAKYYVCGFYHYGYNVPGGTAVVQHMVADAAKSNGMQTITYQGTDSAYGSDIGFVISKGVQHMDGDWALAYARTRVYSTDFNRMQRQQLVLKAMRSSLNDPCALLPSVPSLLGDVGSAFKTNLPIGDADSVRQWAGLAKLIAGKDVQVNVIQPQTIGMSYVNGYPAYDANSWASLKNLVAHSLDNVAPGGGGDNSGGGGGGFSC